MAGGTAAHKSLGPIVLGYDPSPITFQPLTESALPMVYDWLSAPHVRQWWGEPDDEIVFIRQMISHPREQGFLATLDQEPFGYIQSCHPTDYGDEAPWSRGMAPDTVGIDMFIGVAERLGQGLGSAMVHSFCAQLFTRGADYLVLDPDAENTTAIKTYERAGFKHLLDYTTSTGVTHVMDLTRIRFQRTL